MACRIGLNCVTHRRWAPITRAIRPAEEQMIARVDKEIDKLVYELYGLTEEEVGIVEGLNR